jgi:hypothetical protein
MMLWRKRQIADQVANDVGDLPEVETSEGVLDTTEAVYTIGKNDTGHTQFRMKLDYGSATLTMTPVAVIDLIEQLAFAIRKEYTVQVSKND